MTKQKNMPADPLVTAQYAAAALGISKASLYRWIDRGDLPEAVTLGGRKRWRKSTIDAIAGQQAKAA